LVIKQFQKDLFLITLPVDIAGFDDFIGAWVYTGGPVAIIDVGPAATTDVLLSALDELCVKRPDIILLTHIHLDHAGGIGAVASTFPETAVVCHHKGIAHLVDPARLWRGSVKTLGDLAVSYGAMAPVPEKQLVSASDMAMDGIRTVDTPGHSPHHTSYMINSVLFAGEAGGVCLPLPGKGCYLRPATPPRFFLETSRQSIHRLLELSPSAICYGHLGMRTDAVDLLKAHDRQLQHWHAIMVEQYKRADKDTEKAKKACVDVLLADDPCLAGFNTLPSPAQSRERYFLLNSVRGFWGYLDDVTGCPRSSSNLPASGPGVRLQ
jgi:glyoxylase-like metal-dependent hydrolase (beta-lactamase superfamily II)